MRFGLLFPGQGSQLVGMGRELFEQSKLARETYEDADRILGYSISSISFDGPEETLRETRNTQPALFVHGIAAFRVLSELGLEFSVAAGHSLGEYSALTSASALDFADALRLVRRRGELMHEAGVKRPGTMAAILGLSQAEIQEICDEASRVGVVQPANLNSSSQGVISGEKTAVDTAAGLARERGAKRVVMLPVSGAFHSPLMESASVELSRLLADTKINRARFPVIANYSALPVREPEEIRENLAKQVLGTVRWEQSVRQMLSMGVRHFVEAGPGNVLKGLMRSADKDATVLSAGTPGDIASVAALLDKQKVT